ncbi:hypothetical protein O0L34_g14507 [Tuta absoluta]|nr:hypothetical protein O0L34_g14507 [Tuta absoluta]
MCNGELEPKCRRSKRSQSPESSVNGETSPQRNGAHNTHNTRSKHDDDRHYYKVVGVSTKLRSSGACLASKLAPKHQALNGDKPLVVKFRKVRKSELSVLSDEAEQFMFPKRASSTSSTSDDDDHDKEESSSRKKNSTPQPPPTLERRRLARPVALKEESSEEDGWPDDKRRRKRKAPPPVKRGRRLPLKPPEDSQAEEISPVEPGLLNVDLGAAEPPAEDAVSPLRAEPAAERCVRWEAGRLRYSAAVDRLEFAFESVPRSEPWYETFKRQDHDQIITKNVPKYFALYTTSPKLPYEIGTLPPLKPNCCPLSELVRRDDRAGAAGAGGAGGAGAGARCYGTRGKKKQKMRKRTELVQALEAHPRKSPREHASTLAILGSAGLLHRRKNGDDAKSTASEDTISDTQSHLKIEPVVNEALEASERLQQFFAEVFDDAAEYEVSDEAMEGDTALMTSTNAPDVTSLVSECENCDIIRNEIQENVEARARARRGRFKKKNKTGWPNKKKAKKDSRTNSLESQKGESSLDRSSAEPPDDDTTRDATSEVDTNLSEAENEKTLIELKQEEEARVKSEPMETDESPRTNKHTGKRSPRSSNSDSGKRTPRSSASDEDKEERRKKKRALAGLLLQPVVRVARVDPNAARRLRSADKARSGRLR